MRLSYSWVIPIAIFWPALALGVTFVRRGTLPGDGEQIAAGTLGFLLVGVLSGLVLIFLLRRATERSGRIFVVVGYALATPFGYALGIVGPLALEAFPGAQLPGSIVYLVLFPLAIGLYGSLVPICGAAVGFLISRIRSRSS
jgi:hypothetical protein